MLSTEIRLTLSNWPTGPIPQNRFCLSPNTSRTLKESGISAESVLPISLGEFCLTNNLEQLDNKQLVQLYDADRKRRKKKVQILKGLWQKVVKKKEKKRNSSSIKSSRILKRQGVLSDRLSIQHFKKEPKRAQKSFFPPNIQSKQSKKQRRILRLLYSIKQTIEVQQTSQYGG